MRLWLPLLLAASAFQEPPKDRDAASQELPSREEVINDLERRFAECGAVSADLVQWKAKPGGPRELHGKAFIYLDPANSRMYVHHEENKNDPENFGYCDKDTVRIWGAAKKPRMLDWGRHLAPMMAIVEESAKKLHAILDRPVPSSFSDLFLQGHVVITLTVDEDENGDQASLRLSVGRSSKKRDISWFREIREDDKGRFRAGEDGVHFELPSKQKEMVIDRVTGFPREVTLRMKSGELRVLEAKNLKRNPEAPKPRFPERFSIPLPEKESLKDRMRAGIYSLSHLTAQAILRDLDAKAISEKSKTLAEFYRELMVKLCRSVSDGVVGVLIDQAIAKLEANDTSLDEIADQVDLFAEHMEALLKKSASVRAEIAETTVSRSQHETLGCIKHCSEGSPESRAALETIIRQAFDDPRHSDFFPMLPDMKEAVRQALQRAKDAR